MPWMTRWPGAFPVHVAEASGARFVDVDGIEYVDFCLGDTGAMTGHGRGGLAAAVGHSTTMLPSEDAAWVADELYRRFGMAKWQLTTSATDANRFVLRFARHITSRPKIAVVDWCYHGTVDETLAILGPDGAVISRPGAVGPQVDPAVTTRVVPFNDLDALDAALAHGDVAALLMEPALTNIGIVLPEPGYHEAVREITRRHDVLLIIDETHTISAGPGGCTRAWGLEPDIVVIGKPIGGGFPVATYGVTEDIAVALDPALHGHDADVGGVGGTLAGSAMATAAIRATLSTTLLDADYERMIPLATHWTSGVAAAIDEHGTGLVGPAARVPRRVLVLPAARQRCRRCCRRRRRARCLHAPVGAQPGDPDDPVPQHGAAVAGPHRDRRRSPTPRSSPPPSPRSPEPAGTSEPPPTLAPRSSHDDHVISSTPCRHSGERMNEWVRRPPMCSRSRALAEKFRGRRRRRGHPGARRRRPREASR
jgi:glutamate-1-semialdehyde 2,1-aminomutase